MTRLGPESIKGVVPAIRVIASRATVLIRTAPKSLVPVLVALACLFGGARSVHAATTTYTTAYSGGTINPGDTVLLNNGATVTGNVTANGTLQFNQTQALTISNTISGTGTLSLTNTGHST